MMKRSLFVLFCMLSSCVTTPPEVPEAEMPAEVKADLPASTLKRSFKDVDQRQASDDKGIRKRVVVLPFLDRSNDRPREVLGRAQNEFINQLNKSQELIALDSSELKMDLSKYIKNSEYDLKALSQASLGVGASALLEAKVIDLRFKNQSEFDVRTAKKASFEIVVKLRLVNIRSGQELFNSVKTMTLEEENTKLPEDVTSDIFFARNPELVELLIKDAFFDFSPKLVDAMNQVVWEGRIAALQGEKIFLNVGQISGVQVGDILKVVEDSHEVYDPEIGYHLGKVPGKVKGTLEVVGFFGQDGAVSVIHSGAGFKENDRIEIYE